ncbi:hypothetical protein AAX26_02063 [Aliarcobacter thereius]|nr:hypothetical protein AAX26_02063 [Aliarcobacter thereius]
MMLSSKGLKPNSFVFDAGSKIITFEKELLYLEVYSLISPFISKTNKLCSYAKAFGITNPAVFPVPGGATQSVLNGSSLLRSLEPYLPNIIPVLEFNLNFLISFLFANLEEPYSLFALNPNIVNKIPIGINIVITINTDKIINDDGLLGC